MSYIPKVKHDPEPKEPREPFDDDLETRLEELHTQADELLKKMGLLCEHFHGEKQERQLLDSYIQKIELLLNKVPQSKKARTETEYLRELFHHFFTQKQANREQVLVHLTHMRKMFQI